MSTPQSSAQLLLLKGNYTSENCCSFAEVTIDCQIGRFRKICLQGNYDQDALRSIEIVGWNYFLSMFVFVQ